MSKNRHKSKNSSLTHPKPINTTIDKRSTYSPNSIGGRVDLESLMKKLSIIEESKNSSETYNNINDAKDS